MVSPQSREILQTCVWWGRGGGGNKLAHPHHTKVCTIRWLCGAISSAVFNKSWSKLASLKMKKWSSQWTQFMQLRKQAWKKIQYFNGVWTLDLAIPVRCSSNWAMKPLTLGAGHLWVHMFPWKKWVLVIYEINHIFADFNAFLSAMLTIDGFSLTGSSQKLKNPWKSMLSRNC